MPFDLNDLNPSERHYWPGDKAGEEWVDLKLTSDADQLETVKRVGIDRKQTFKANPISKRMERIEFIDTTLEKGEEFAYDLFDQNIVAWNLKTPSGEEIPCTRENKVLMMTQSLEFREWVDKCLGAMEKRRKEWLEGLEKNSSSSPGGSVRSPRANGAEKPSH